MINQYVSVGQPAYMQDYLIPADIQRYISNTSDFKLYKDDWPYLALVFNSLERKKCFSFIAFTCPNVKNSTSMSRVDLARLWLEHRCEFVKDISIKSIAHDFARNGFFEEVRIIQKLFPSDNSVTNYADILTDDIFKDDDYEFLLKSIRSSTFAHDPKWLRVFGGFLGINLDELPLDITAERLIELIKQQDLKFESEHKLKWAKIASIFLMLGEEQKVNDIERSCRNLQISKAKEKQVTINQQKKWTEYWIEQRLLGENGNYSMVKALNLKSPFTCVREQGNLHLHNAKSATDKKGFLQSQHNYFEQRGKELKQSSNSRHLQAKNYEQKKAYNNPQPSGARDLKSIATRDLPFAYPDEEVQKAPKAMMQNHEHREVTLCSQYATNQSQVQAQELSYNQSYSYHRDTNKPTSMCPHSQPISDYVKQPSVLPRSTPNHSLSQPTGAYEVKKVEPRLLSQSAHQSLTVAPMEPIAPVLWKPRTWKIICFLTGKHYHVAKAEGASFNKTAGTNRVYQPASSEVQSLKMTLSIWSSFKDVLSKITPLNRQAFLLELSAISKTKYKHNLKIPKSNKGISASYLSGVLRSGNIDNLITVLSEPRNQCTWNDAIEALKKISEFAIARELQAGMQLLNTLGTDV